MRKPARVSAKRVVAPNVVADANKSPQEDLAVQRLLEQAGRMGAQLPADCYVDGSVPPTDSLPREPGICYEVMWRAMLFQAASNQDTALIEEARELCGFVDPFTPPQTDSKGDGSSAAAWGLSQRDGWKMIMQHANMVANVRPHGFVSVGKVAPGSPLAVLLQHGLALLMANMTDTVFTMRSGVFDDRAARLHRTVHEHLAAHAADNIHPLLASQMSARVLMFDALGLRQQLERAQGVLQGLLLPGEPLPPDTALSMAAFHKLLLLGTLAPLEEAVLETAERRAAMRDADDLEAARQAAGAAAHDDMSAAASRLCSALGAQLEAQQVTGAAILQLLGELHGGEAGLPSARQLQQLLEQGPLSALPSLGAKGGAATQMQPRKLGACLAAAWPALMQRLLLAAQGPAAAAAAACSHPTDLLRMLGGADAAPTPANAGGPLAFEQLLQALERPQDSKLGSDAGSGSAGSKACDAGSAGPDGSSAAHGSARAAAVGLEAASCLLALVQAQLHRTLAAAPPPCSGHGQPGGVWSGRALQRLLRSLVELERLRGALTDAVQLGHMQPILDGLCCPSSKQAGEPRPELQAPQPLAAALLAALQQLELLRAELAGGTAWGTSAAAAAAGSTPGAAGSAGARLHARAPAEGSADACFWRRQAWELYGTLRPVGREWLQHCFPRDGADSSRPGFWGVLCGVLRPSVLNVRASVEPLLLEAAIFPGATPPWDFDAERADARSSMCAQVARLANAHEHVQCGEAADRLLPAHVLANLLRACCLLSVPLDGGSAAAAAPLPYARLAASVSGGAGGERGKGLAPGAAHVAGAWRAMRARWEGAPLHLHSLVAAAPLFEERHQSACLARLLDLLAQYHGDISAAAQQLRAAACSTGPCRASFPGSGTHGASLDKDMIPCSVCDAPEQTPLLVVLLGLYHLRMQQQQAAALQLRPRHSAGAAYGDAAVRLESCELAAADAAEMQELLTYCIAGGSEEGRRCAAPCSLARLLAQEPAAFAHNFSLTAQMVGSQCVLGGVALIAPQPEQVLPSGFDPGLPFAGVSFEPPCCELCSGQLNSGGRLAVCRACSAVTLCVSCAEAGAHTAQQCAALQRAAQELDGPAPRAAPAAAAAQGEAARCGGAKCAACAEACLLASQAALRRTRLEPRQLLLVPWAAREPGGPAMAAAAALPGLAASALRRLLSALQPAAARFERWPLGHELLALHTRLLHLWHAPLKLQSLAVGMVLLRLQQGETAQQCHASEEELQHRVALGALADLEQSGLVASRGMVQRVSQGMEHSMYLFKRSRQERAPASAPGLDGGDGHARSHSREARRYLLRMSLPAATRPTAGHAGVGAAAAPFGAAAASASLLSRECARLASLERGAGLGGGVGGGHGALQGKADAASLGVDAGAGGLLSGGAASSFPYPYPGLTELDDVD